MDIVEHLKEDGSPVALQAVKEIERLRSALLLIMEDDEGPSHPCGPKQYGYYGRIACSALTPPPS